MDYNQPSYKALKKEQLIYSVNSELNGEPEDQLDEIDAEHYVHNYGQYGDEKVEVQIEQEDNMFSSKLISENDGNGKNTGYKE